jgi:hypothetical protein
VRLLLFLVRGTPGNDQRHHHCQQQPISDATHVIPPLSFNRRLAQTAANCFAITCLRFFYPNNNPSQDSGLFVRAKTAVAARGWFRIFLAQPAKTNGIYLDPLWEASQNFVRIKFRGETKEGRINQSLIRLHPLP